MTIEQTVYSTLTGDADVGPLVVNTDSTYRIYPVGEVPESPTTKPYITYTVIYGEHAATFSGRNTLKNARMQIDAYGTTYAAVRALADHIIDAIDTNMAVGAIQDQHFYEDDVELHRMMTEFSLWA